MPAERVRGHDPSMPVLMTTGHSDEMSLDGPQAMTLEVLDKPCKRSEMIDRVAGRLAARRPHRG